MERSESVVWFPGKSVRRNRRPEEAKDVMVVWCICVVCSCLPKRRDDL